MKLVIVREVKALIFKPVASTSAAAQASASASAHLGEKGNTHIRFANDEDKKLLGKARDGGKSKVKGKDKGEGSSMERWNTHAWYYAVVTLNQIVLSPTESDRAVARTLIGMYFDMFQEILGSRDGETDGAQQAVEGEAGNENDGENKGSVRKGLKEKGKGKPRTKESKGAAGFAEVEDESSRLMSAVLSGVNRALPFAKVDGADEM